MKHKYLLIFSSVFLLLACDNDDLKAPVPAFLTINDISVKARNGIGTESDNITDAKVFINDQSLGSFQLPATVPIQNTGAVNLKIRSVILNRGNSNDKRDYPFYTDYEEDIIFEQEVEVVRNPQVEYEPTVDFDSPWSGEDFESGVNFEFNPASDAAFIRETDPDEVFEGTASGVASLTTDQDFFEAWIPTFSDIPRNGQAVYLEMNYKCTHLFAISVFVNNQSSQNPVVFFRPSSEWKKAYIELGEIFSLFSGATNYTIAIGFTKPVGEEGKLSIDNVKLGH